MRGTGAVRRPNVTYRQQWDSTRAVTEALQRVTWVYRSVDAIASNAARLPLVIRQDDQLDGEIVEDQDLYRLLNSRPNLGEDSVAFRYRLSSQLLLSRKGVFIEVNRNRGGEILSLVLLPPDAMTIVPDMKKFIAGYELDMQIMVDGRQEQFHKSYKPEDVIWLRKPHPFDPYGALTPLEAAGLAIETDWLAKMYNRNFMLNDGRPGGLVVVKGDMTEDDKEELRSKFSGSISRAGRISVIASEEGADFVDTAITPRDAQYVDMRKVTKEEILMAFGVPETVIANAAGRTFDNAEIERVIFWMETMQPHMDLIVRPLDMLDPEPDTFMSYDLSRVDVLQRMEMKRREYVLREFDAGALSSNEYREATSRETIANPLADILWIPKTKMPVVTTDGEEPPVIAAAQPIAPQGRPPSDTVTEQPEADPVPRENDPRQAPLDNTPNSAPADQGSGSKSLEIKTEPEVDETSLELWSNIAFGAVDRLVERAARVAGEKASGQKFRKAFFNSETQMSDIVETVLDGNVWSKQLFDDIVPVARGAAVEGGFKGLPDEQIKSVRGVNIVALMQEAVKTVVEAERSASKPDMQNLPVKVSNAILEVGRSEAVSEQMRKFAKFYLTYS